MIKKSGIILAIGLLTAGFSLVFILPKASLAVMNDDVDFSLSSNKQIFVGSDEIINDNFVGIAELIDINGTINGDILVAGGTVNINSTVQGDVIAAGGKVRIKGDVAGNVRVAGGDVEVDATIGKNANLFGGTVSISEDSSIGWSLTYWSGTATIKGIVGGHLDGGAGQTLVAAEVGGHANIRAEDEGTITLNPPAQIGGDLTYWGNTNPVINDGAEIKGEVIQKSSILPSVKQDVFKFLGISIWFLKLVDLFGLLVIGLVAISLFKKPSVNIVEWMKKEPAKSMGWGIIYLIVTPIAIGILVITIIGIPLALVTAALYAIALYLSKLFAGLLFGYWIFQYLKKNKKDKSVPLMWAMILGIVLYSLVIAIPYFGWLVSIVGAIWALGALLENLKRYLKENK